MIIVMSEESKELGKVGGDRERERREEERFILELEGKGSKIGVERQRGRRKNTTAGINYFV